MDADPISNLVLTIVLGGIIVIVLDQSQDKTKKKIDNKNSF
ncbi:MAG: hypothetical protein ACW981_00745 [Candidatus Hodarchaeales archaeon]|jgi:hypothetical protein